eukprot:COSAG02_NODE_2163_length_9619_cov_7.068592_4_plen_66_part_00
MPGIKQDRLAVPQDVCIRITTERTTVSRPRFLCPLPALCVLCLQRAQECMHSIVNARECARAGVM